MVTGKYFISLTTFYKQTHKNGKIFYFKTNIETEKFI